MIATLEAPVAFVESLARLKFPGKTNRRMQELMDKNSDGLLSTVERDELESLVELSETMSLFRGEALRLLGRKPQ